MEGFKSIRDSLNIRLRPLTVLCGANSSGKTSALQPLLLVKQTLEVGYDPGPLLLSGDNVKFSNTGEMLWRGQGGDTAEHMAVGLTDYGGESLRLIFGKGSAGVELQANEYREAPGPNATAYTLRPGLGQDELREVIPPDYRDLVEMVGSRKEGRAQLALRRSRCFFGVRIAIREQPEDAGVLLPAYGGGEDFAFFRNYATQLIHLPGLRDNPSRFYPATQVGRVFPGVFQPYFASVIASWAGHKDPKLERLGEELATLGLTWKVDAKRIDETRVALRVGRLPRPARGGARDMVNIADVGLGLSQTLPVLVALLAAQPGQIVYLEQPEIHLHPRAQVALASVLLDAAQRGVVVIAETHSYLLLRGIQELAARNQQTNLVQLHWFERNDSGVTHTHSGELDPNGAFADWPSDFADVELEVEERFVQTALTIMRD